MIKADILTKIESLKNFLKNFLREHCCIYNKLENQELTEDFISSLKAIKEYNSKNVWDLYYLPKAISAILKEEGYLTTMQQAVPRAKAMLLADLANGVLDEFYRFK